MDKEKSKLSQKEAMRIILKVIGIAFPIIIFVNYLVYFYVPWPEVNLPTSIDRIIHIIQWHTLSVGTLWSIFQVQQEIFLNK